MTTLLLIVGFFGLSGVFCQLVARVIRPLNQAAEGNMLPTRVSVADLLCLLLLVHVPWIVVLYLSQKSVPNLDLGRAVYIVSWIGWGILWLNSVATLSRAGVMAIWPRAVFLSVVLPVLALGTIAQPSVLRSLLIPAQALVWGGEVALFLLLGACGWLTRWIVGTGNVGKPEIGDPAKGKLHRISDFLRRDAIVSPVVWDLLLLNVPFKAVACAMAPLERAVTERRKPAQFTIADLLCLFLLVHLSSTVVYYLCQTPPGGDMFIVYVFGWGSWTALWWASVRKLSQAGVTSSRHRTLFLLLVLPWLLAGSIVQIPVLGWLIMSLGLLSCSDPTAPAHCLGSLASEVGLVATFYACAWFTYRIVAVAGHEEPQDKVRNREDQETAGRSP